MPTAAADQAEARDREGYQRLLAEPHLRRVVRQLLLLTGIDDIGPVHSEGPMGHHAGKRTIGLYLVERMKLLNPEGWVRFESEYLQERQLLQGALKQKEDQAKERKQEMAESGVGAIL